MLGSRSLFFLSLISSRHQPQPTGIPGATSPSFPDAADQPLPQTPVVAYHSRRLKQSPAWPFPRSGLTTALSDSSNLASSLLRLAIVPSTIVSTISNLFRLSHHTAMLPAIDLSSVSTVATIPSISTIVGSHPPEEKEPQTKGDSG